MNSSLHIGIDSICILRVSFGFELKGLARIYQERKAMPTATIADGIGRLNVCFAAVRKLMGRSIYVVAKQDDPKNVISDEMCHDFLV